MHFHFAMNVYSSEKYCSYNPTCENVINKFVSESISLFGKQIATANWHTILQLPKFVEDLGEISNFSAFCFENYLGNLKRRIKAWSNKLSAAIKIFNFFLPETILFFMKSTLIVLWK